MQTAEDTKRRPKFVDANAVAQVYDLHPESIRRMAREDRIEAVRIGGRWRFPARIIRDPRNEKSPSPEG